MPLLGENGLESRPGPLHTRFQARAGIPNDDRYGSLTPRGHVQGIFTYNPSSFDQTGADPQRWQGGESLSAGSRDRTAASQAPDVHGVACSVYSDIF